MSCSKNVKYRIIVFQDKGNKKCKITFYNHRQRNLIKHIVDGCLIKDGNKCDFMLDCPTYEHYIEIKGKDVVHACNQIETSINVLSKDKSYYPKKSYIISTGVPPSISGSIQIYIKRFKKKYNSSLIIKTNYHEENID